MNDLEIRDVLFAFADDHATYTVDSIVLSRTAQAVIRHMDDSDLERLHVVAEQYRCGIEVGEDYGSRDGFRNAVHAEATMTRLDRLPDTAVILQCEPDRLDQSNEEYELRFARQAMDRLGVPVMLVAKPATSPDGTCPIVLDSDENPSTMWLPITDKMQAAALSLDVCDLADGGAQMHKGNSLRIFARMDGPRLVRHCVACGLMNLSEKALRDAGADFMRDRMAISTFETQYPELECMRPIYRRANREALRYERQIESRKRCREVGVQR